MLYNTHAPKNLLFVLCHPNVHILETLKITKHHRRSKFDFTSIYFWHHCYRGCEVPTVCFRWEMSILFFHQSMLEFHMLMARQWMAWTNFPTCMLGAEPKQKILKMNSIWFFEVFMRWSSLKPKQLVWVSFVKWWRSQLHRMDWYYTNSFCGW